MTIEGGSSTSSTWPPPSVRWEIPDIPLRVPLPVYPPPEDVLTLPPSLPSPQRHPCLHPSFKLSTHLVPAAYLRTTRHVASPPASIMPDWKMPNGEKLQKGKETRRWLIDVRGSDSEGKKGYEKVLWICVNRYYRFEENKKTSGKGVTLFFAHANGFPKEIWEPTLKCLLASCSQLIDEVWTWEAVQHGDSALVNQKSLSYLYDWIDNARDILNFFTYFVPSSASSELLPVHLSRVPDSISNERAAHGLRERNIIAVGHSFGGCTSTFAALICPDLFSSLMLVDPVILNPLILKGDDAFYSGLGLGALIRRETWKSKSDALSIFKKNPFFSAWDPKVLDLYVECGLYSARDAEGNEIAKLKTSKLQEACVFLAPQVQFEVYANLHTLDERIALKWVMPGLENSNEMGPPGSAQQRVWLRPANSSNVKIPDAGHLIAQEKPTKLAEEIRDWIRDLLKETRPVPKL